MVQKNFKICRGIVHENVDGEVIVINLENGFYFSLHKTAAVVWAMLEKNVQLESIAQNLSAHYKVDYLQVKTDIEHLLKELEVVGLIESVELDAVLSQASCNLSSLVNLPASYTAPVLETYADMKMLLMIDPVHEVDQEGWPHRASVQEATN